MSGQFSFVSEVKTQPIKLEIPEWLVKEFKEFCDRAALDKDSVATLALAQFILQLKLPKHPNHLIPGSLEEFCVSEYPPRNQKLE